jgi:hypothetical protein
MARSKSPKTSSSQETPRKSAMKVQPARELPHRGEWKCTKTAGDDDSVVDAVGVNEYLLNELMEPITLKNLDALGYETGLTEKNKARKFLRINAPLVRWMQCLNEGTLYLCLYNMHDTLGDGEHNIEILYYDEIRNLGIIYGDTVPARICVSLPCVFLFIYNIIILL